MKEVKTGLLIFLIYVALFALLFFNFAGATPVGPDSTVIESNTTKATLNATMINISGGRVLIFNVSSIIQDIRWKAMIGSVSGSFTLDDAGGSTVYDWDLAAIGGEVYATSNSSTITWSNLTCANVANLNSENTKMSLTSSADNLTATFNISSGATHAEFFVATRNITVNTCPTLNTFVNDSRQDVDFEEVALYEYLGGNVVYASILEQDVSGYNNVSYDFQMIVPENGASGWTGSTAYYLYVEIS